MKPRDFLVRCVAFKEGGQWVGVCLNFDLAAQADTLQEVQDALDDQVRTYIREALAGPDRAFAPDLLRRRAPLKYWIRYWMALFAHKLRVNFKNTQEYESPLPLMPA